MECSVAASIPLRQLAPTNVSNGIHQMEAGQVARLSRVSPRRWREGHVPRFCLSFHKISDAESVSVPPQTAAAPDCLQYAKEIRRFSQQFHCLMVSCFTLFPHYFTPSDVRHRTTTTLKWLGLDTAMRTPSMHAIVPCMDYSPVIARR